MNQYHVPIPSFSEIKLLFNHSLSLSLYYNSLSCAPTECNASTFNVHRLTKSIAGSLVDLVTSYPPCFLEQLQTKLDMLLLSLSNDIDIITAHPVHMDCMSTCLFIPVFLIYFLARSFAELLSD